MSKILSINVASIIHEGEWTGSEGRTGIDKRSVVGNVLLANDSVAGDVVVDRKHHGGYDKAVYAYAREDADWWEGQIGREISNGQFGENLTTLGIDLNSCLIGERWQIGEVVLEVSEPRIPCRVFAGFWDRPSLIKEFTDARRSGAYLRIIKEGRISAGDQIEVIFNPEHEVTIKDIFDAKAGERGKIKEIRLVEALSTSYKEWAAKVDA